MEQRVGALEVVRSCGKDWLPLLDEIWRTVSRARMPNMEPFGGYVERGSRRHALMTQVREDCTCILAICVLLFLLYKKKLYHRRSRLRLMIRSGLSAGYVTSKNRAHIVTFLTLSAPGPED